MGVYVLFLYFEGLLYIDRLILITLDLYQINARQTS
jgi:hypothetical protein